MQTIIYIYTLQKLITTTGPCPRPELMTVKQLYDELQSRGLSSHGSLKQRQSILETDDRSMHVKSQENIIQHQYYYDLFHLNDKKGRFFNF